MFSSSSTTKVLVIILAIVSGLFVHSFFYKPVKPLPLVSPQVATAYWFSLHRKSNQEFLYQGVPGDTTKSMLIKSFQVKTGIPGERPTPLPQLVGRDYWLITTKEESKESPETAPYFLTLDVPVTEEEPYGPVPYLECNGQCNWILPGAFGLHGVAGDISKVSADNPGSSGCIRHKDEDITYLYQLLDPQTSPIRYYIADI